MATLPHSTLPSANTPVSGLTREELFLLIREALADRPCRFDIGPKEVDHLIGMVADVGNGSLRAGIERLRQHHLWLIDRLEADEEYAANHDAMSGARGVAREFGRKATLFFMSLLALILAAGFLGYSAAKFGFIKFNP